MKSNLSYWSGTKEEMEDIQEKCFQSYITDMSNYADYKVTTTALTDVFNPLGEDDELYVMRIPSGLVKKQSLINQMTAHNDNIQIIKSKGSWNSNVNGGD